ncbi:WD_REPEATS_REGION domain-containing protein, partial [Linnemannia gamsii]
MASNPLKRPAPHAFDDNDSNIDHPVGKREDHRNKTILDGQATLLPVLDSYGSTDDATYVIENSLMALKVRRVEEYRQPVYIPPMAKANLQAKDEDLFPLMAKVQEFLDSDRQVMLILGDSGAGKSTFNRHLEHHLWTHYTNGDPIPLIINLPAIERPDQDMITKQLQMHDISNDQIQEMKHHCQFILICDGYDESQLSANLHQTNRLNQRGQWRTKMIISCRTQFLGPVYLDRFAPQLTDRYTKARSDLFQEAVIAPFSTKQVEDYVARYVPLEPRPWVTEDYMLMLTTIPNLMDLVRNPFLLTLTLEALPSVTRSQQ